MKVEVKEKVAVKDPLYKVLKDVFGFESFKGSQEAIIRNLMAGKDTFVIMPTGSGKSLCYQLPAIISEGTAIVVSPLIALMKNQVDAIRNFGMELGLAHYLNSSLSRQELVQVKNDLAEGRTKLLYVAPESLTKDDNVELFKSIKISFYAIDEAHCISEWGHDFRPEYRRIRPMIEAIGQEVPVMALTATATPKVQQDIQKNLALMNATLFKTSFNRPNLYYEVRPKTESVLKDIIKYIKSQPGKSGIVYCLSRKKVEEVAEALQVNGIRAVPYHAGLDPQTRRENQDRFLMEDAEVVVATIAFGMGIDKPDIRYVIHHDIPKSLEGYYQETGRAGRDGGEGNCIVFYSYDDILKLEKFLKNKHVAEQEITKLLLSETVAYAETTICRRKVLLHYFGEQYTQDNCGSCDNCLHPKTRYDGKEAVLTVLDAITQTKQQCKSKHLVHVITGKLTANVKAAKHHKLEVFAKGEEYDEPYWHSVIRQMLVENLIEKEIENYGILKITNEGRKFLKKPKTIMLTQDREYDNNEDDELIDQNTGAKPGTADATLFALLKDLRKEISRKENLPPFVIFQDPSLEEMAIQYPITIDELKQITGVGAGKALKFGKPFIDLIKNYVEENEIIRPNDMVIKSVINKSGLKIYIIQSIDRKVPLEDIALAKNLSFDELLTEIEHIVASGTKIDISYYIDEYIDEYHQEEVYEYFRTAETDSVEKAREELGEEEFSEEEIRLMRIKFISEMGN
ncbi:MAG: DNA helicase RecQ [Lentimicrobium sp.]|jgi:ATP-dependent DNA helicase RecQ